MQIITTFHKAADTLLASIQHLNPKKRKKLYQEAPYKLLPLSWSHPVPKISFSSSIA